MYEIGARWEAAEITVADEHLATAITQSVLVSLAGRLRRARRDRGRDHRVAVTGSGPEDHHALGARMVADFLHAAGWRVLDLGPSTPADGFAQVAEAHGAQVVAVSTSLSQHLDGVRAVRAALDDLPQGDRPLLAVGGRAYTGHPERARSVGADVHATDPAALLHTLEERLAA